MDANSGEPWSETDISDLTKRPRPVAETASLLHRDEDEVREKAKKLGLVEQPDKHVRVVP